MTLTDIQNAISFLRKVYVGKGDEDRFIQTLNALQREHDKRVKQPATR